MSGPVQAPNRDHSLRELGGWALVTGLGLSGASPPSCPCPPTLTLGPPGQGGASLKTDGPSYKALGTGHCVSPARFFAGVELPCWG